MTTVGIQGWTPGTDLSVCIDDQHYLDVTKTKTGWKLSVGTPEDMGSIWPDSDCTYGSVNASFVLPDWVADTLGRFLLDMPEEGDDDK